MKKRAIIATALLSGSLLVSGVPASQAATTTPSPKPSVSGGVAGDADNGRGTEFKAFRDCLAKNGVKNRIPGQPGGGGFGTPGAQPKLDAKTQKALAACASLRPKGGFGDGFRAGGTAFAAFVSCMKDHKVTIPAPNFGARPTTTPKPGATSTAKPSIGGGQGPGRGFLSGLNQKDPKVAAALKICGALLPTRN